MEGIAPSMPRLKPCGNYHWRTLLRRIPHGHGRNRLEIYLRELAQVTHRWSFEQQVHRAVVPWIRNIPNAPCPVRSVSRSSCRSRRASLSPACIPSHQSSQNPPSTSSWCLRPPSCPCPSTLTLRPGFFRLLGQLIYEALELFDVTLLTLLERLFSAFIRDGGATNLSGVRQSSRALKDPT